MAWLGGAPALASEGLFLSAQATTLEPEPQMSSDLIAQKVLDVLRRAKDPTHQSIASDHPLSSESTLTPAVATRTLDIISQLARQNSSGSQPGQETPVATLAAVKNMAGTLPGTLPHFPPVQGIAPPDLSEALKVVRELHEQAKASLQTK